MLRKQEVYKMEEKIMDCKETEFKKPRVKFIFSEDDAICVLRCVRKALLNAGFEKQANSFLIEASKTTYENLLQVVLKYVDIV